MDEIYPNTYQHHVMQEHTFYFHLHLPLLAWMASRRQGRREQEWRPSWLMMENPRWRWSRWWKNR